MTNLDTSDITIDSGPEGFRGLPELARRLGVEPGTGPQQLGFCGDDGRHYDIMQMLHAMLDRLDEAEEQIATLQRGPEVVRSMVDEWGVLR